MTHESVVWSEFRHTPQFPSLLGLFFVYFQTLFLIIPWVDLPTILFWRDSSISSIVNSTWDFLPSLPQTVPFFGSPHQKIRLSSRVLRGLDSRILEYQRHCTPSNLLYWKDGTGLRLYDRLFRPHLLGNPVSLNVPVSGSPPFLRSFKRRDSDRNLQK